jgi:hypothetical protein
MNDSDRAWQGVRPYAWSDSTRERTIDDDILTIWHCDDCGLGYHDDVPRYGRGDGRQRCRECHMRTREPWVDRESDAMQGKMATPMLTRFPLTTIATGSGHKTRGVVVGVMAHDLNKLELDCQNAIAERGELRRGIAALTAAAALRDAMEETHEPDVNRAVLSAEIARLRRIEAAARHALHVIDTNYPETQAYWAALGALRDALEEDAS